MPLRVFSGIQPTGNLTIGNYFGALVNFRKLQESKECFFCVVNLHALTTPFDPEKLRKKTLEMAGLFLASGVDPEKAAVFVQGDVAEHAQMNWLLECHTYFGELGRMTQFKEKSSQKEAVTAGLFTYPVLMAADILLYQADLVPTGEDQKQHLELTRDLAQRINNRYGTVFQVPELYIPRSEDGGRIMSLLEPGNKMSKTDSNPGNYIALLDDPDTVRKKIKNAVTDSGKSIEYNLGEKAGISNLLVIYSLCSGKPVAEIEEGYRGKGYGKFKEDLAELLIENLRPIQEKYAELTRQRIIEEGLDEGKNKAQKVAQKNLKKLKEKLGLERGENS